MSLTDFHHGILYVRDNSTTLRPIQTVRSSVIGAVVTAPDADPSVFPLNEPVLIIGRDAEKIAKLGQRGTAKWVIDGILDQGYGAWIIVVRVERHPKPITSVYQSVINRLLSVSGEVMNRTPNTETDNLAHADVNFVNKVYMGNTEYTRGVDWTRDENSIRWLTYTTVETISRRTSTTDPLLHSNIGLELIEVSQGATQYQVGTDCRLTQYGVEWIGNSQPAVHSEYIATYKYGNRPAENQDYQVDYSHYAHESTTDVVNRTTNGDYDFLGNRDVLRINSVSQGETLFIRSTDYELSDDRVHWKRTQVVESVTKGATDNDTIAHSSVINISEVSMGQDIYTKNVDWEFVTPNKIHWLSTNKPEEMDVYNVTYEYGTRPAENSDYMVSYDFKAGEVVALSNVIGGINNDGLYEGLYALLGAQSIVHVTPKILIAPGFTHYASVVHELVGIAEELLAVILADGPNMTDKDAISYRKEFGNPRVFITDPWVKFYNTDISATDQQPSSARVAGLINKVDNEEGFWVSPSNHEINGIDGTSRPISLTFSTMSKSNYLNENKVTTIIHDEYNGGYKLWGNRTCSEDPLSSFLAWVRVDDIIQESVVRAMQFFVDKPVTNAFFETISETLSGFLRSLPEGAIILGDKTPVWIDPKKNTIPNLMAGKVAVDYDFMFTPVAEKIQLTRHINSEYLKTLFKKSPYVRGDVEAM